MVHSAAKLFQPIRVGNCQLSHRVVLAPLTRFRNDDAHVPTELMVEHYAQRASIPGTLVIAEATVPTPRGAGVANVPGIWSDVQVDAWKKVVDAVHAQGSFIYLQLWATGRTAEPSILALLDCPQNPGGPYPYVSSSDLPLSDRNDGIKPRPLAHEEILEYIDAFGAAAHNAVHRAGFDGVELHGAHGYLIDQFTKDVCNKRTDAWGGSLENRIRFAFQVLKKVVAAIGEERTALRLSPFADHRDMGMIHPQPTFAFLVSLIRDAWPRFSYLHIVEPRVAGVNDRQPIKGESLDFLRAIWKSPEGEKNGSVFMAAGGYTAADALRVSGETGDLIAFGRYYISNPDLPARIKNDIPFTPYNRATFYIPGSTIPEGYTDYTFADAEAEVNYEEKKKTRTNTSASTSFKR